MIIKIIYVSHKAGSPGAGNRPHVKETAACSAKIVIIPHPDKPDAAIPPTFFGIIIFCCQPE